MIIPLERRNVMNNGASSYRRFLEGDSNGLVEIIRDYKDGLILYLNGIVQNLYVAEDLTEDTFVKLVVKKPYFSGRSSFKTWLYAIARNVAIDYLRSDAKIKEISVDEFHNMANDEENLEQTYIRSEDKITVHRALSKLKSEYRQVIYLTFFEGLDNKQAAKVMRKSKRQIENLIYRAKMSLKEQLIKEGFSYEEL